MTLPRAVVQMRNANDTASPWTRAYVYSAENRMDIFMSSGLKADDNVRSVATDLQETELLCSIEGGDLIALDALGPQRG